MQFMSSICSVGALVGLAIGAACSTELHGHCSHENNNGDFTCAERGAGQFCDGCKLEGDGCTDVRPTEECHVAGVAATGSTTGGEGTTTTTQGATTTPEPGVESSAGEASGEEPCTGNDGCGGGTPICEMSTGQCVRCDEVSGDHDDACEGLDHELPWCIEGVCAQCDEGHTCGAAAPVCNAAHTCVGCTEHSQCGEAACNFYTGECLSDRIVHVGPDAVMNHGDMGYDDLTSAVASFTEMTSLKGTIIVHYDDYNDTIVVDGGRAIAFIASGDDFPKWDNDEAATSQLTVTDGTAILDGLMLHGAPSAAPSVRIDGGLAWIDRSQIVDNNGDGINVENGAELNLRDSFVGGDANNRTALSINSATAHVLSSTLASGGSGARALACGEEGTVTVDARNSLFVTREDTEDEVLCPGAIIKHSAAEMDLGETNVALGPMDPMDPNWFEDYTVGDLHLTAHAPDAIATAARWRAGDPTTDIDGDPRPIDGEPDEYGVPDYAGADVP